MTEQERQDTAARLIDAAQRTLLDAPDTPAVILARERISAARAMLAASDAEVEEMRASGLLTKLL